MRTFLPLLLALGVTGRVHGAEQRLWPSEQSQARALPDSRMTVIEGGAVRVEAGANDDWPGVCVGFKSGSADLSAYDEVRVALRNVGDRPVQIFLGFKNQRPKDWFLAPKGHVRLQPGERGEIVAGLRLPPVVTDRSLGLVGMHGKPGPLAGEIFDLSLVHELHLSLDAARTAATFELLGIVVASREEQRAVLSADRFFPFVDRFGQFAHAAWPGKIRDEAELRAARGREAAALAADPGSAEWDRWGGWARGPQLKATGRFRTEKVGEKWWLVDPDGRLFFSHGVDGVLAGQATGVTGRERYFAWLPAEGDPLAAFFSSGGRMPYRAEGSAGPYRTYDFLKANLFRKYGAEWEATLAETAHRRLRAWGLNTVANWSEPCVCALRRTPYVAAVNGAWRSIANWCPDPFSPGFTNELHLSLQALKESGAAADPWCLGVFVDNEMGWGPGNSPSALAREVLRLSADRPAKRAFVERLQMKHADIAALNAAWKTSFESWEGLLKSAESAEKWTCENDCAEFLTEFAERYFSTVRDALKAVAPELLYLGCRFAWGPDRVYRAASRYCDVVSLNLYRHTVCKSLPEGCEDKPVIIGEFHFGAMDRGAFHTGLGIANDQAERAELYKGYLRSALAHPRCVGAHWFQWSDQPLTGRGDGENYPVGFVTVTDAPYPELTAAAREIGEAMYAERYGAAADGADADQRAQLERARAWLSQHPPDGENASARRERMAVIQAAGDRLSAADYRDYARSWETNKPLADLLEAKHPVLRYLRDTTAGAMEDIRRTRVREGLAVWFLYNMGYVFKTPRACFGIDLDGRNVERLAPELDFLLNTHEHGDHVHEPLFRELLAQNKPVVTRRYPGSLQVSQSTNFVFGEVQIRIDIGDHHREQPRQRDNMLMFEVDCGPSANHAAIYHSGDGNNVEKMRPAKPVDLFILHTSVGMSVPDAIRHMRPKMTFVSHVMELGHSPLPPHAWRWSYDYAFDVIRDLPARQATVLSWGDRWLAPGTSLQRAPAE